MISGSQDLLIPSLLHLLLLRDIIPYIKNMISGSQDLLIPSPLHLLLLRDIIPYIKKYDFRVTGSSDS